MRVPGHHRQTYGYTHQLRQLGDPHRDLTFLRMSVLRMAYHRLLGPVAEIHQRRPLEHSVHDLRPVLGQEHLSEGGDDRFLVPPEDLDGAVQTAHIELSKSGHTRRIWA